MAKSSKHSARRNNKLLLALLVFLIGAFLMIYAFVPADHEKNEEQGVPPDAATVLSTATVVIPDTTVSVALKNGSGTFNSVESAGIVRVEQPYLVVETAEGYDLFATMIYNTGGSGEFVTVALFESKDGDVMYKGAYPIGDRVPVTALHAPEGTQGLDYSVQVNYLDRTPEQSMADAPTDKKRVTLHIKDHQITTQPYNN